LRKVFSCIRGEQLPMTTRFKRFLTMASRTESWPGSLQVYLLASAKATMGNFLAASSTLSMLIVPPMLAPQWQMKTPTLAIACSL
jgi:hypothetical protein